MEKTSVVYYFLSLWNWQVRVYMDLWLVLCQKKKQIKPMLTCNHGSKRIKELVKEPTLNRRMFVGTLIKLHGFFQHFSKP